jgi:hypothetical protein
LIVTILIDHTPRVGIALSRDAGAARVEDALEIRARCLRQLEAEVSINEAATRPGRRGREDGEKSHKEPLKTIHRIGDGTRKISELQQRLFREDPFRRCHAQRLHDQGSEGPAGIITRRRILPKNKSP